MKTPCNGYAGERLPGRRGVDTSEDMASYDELPARLRALVREMPINIAAESVATLLEASGRTRTARALVVYRRQALAECRRLSEEACAL